VNLRPVTLLHPSLCPLKDPPSGPRAIDFAIVRENTEGIYVGAGGGLRVGTPDEVQLAEEVHTRKGVERIVRYAFEWAQAHGKTRVTMSDKANAVPAHRLWTRVFTEVGAEYPRIEREHRYVDALAMELVREPERFQVIVTQNLFGDILSDLAAQLVGGLGISPSANLHPGRVGLFEPVHGSAPPLAGKDAANPLAAILTGAMLLRELGAPDAPEALEQAARDAIAAGVTTPDLGGTSGTRTVAAWIAERLRR
jgi:3-isopropylmalate dehydrogenase